MRNNYIIFFFIFIFIGIISIFILTRNNFKENYDEDINIDMYVITLRHENRMKNIEKQAKKIGKEIGTDIILFDAVKGDHLDDDYTKSIDTSRHYNGDYNIKKREMGCYLSHFGVYEKIKENNKSGYTIIFEDDFIVEDENIIETTKNSIRQLKNKGHDFDMLFLGNIDNTHGENIVDNLYFAKNPLIGAHGYVINNNKIDKIIKNIGKTPDTPIDLKIDELLKNLLLNIIVFYPSIVNQGGADTSTIRDINIENYKNYEIVKKFLLL
jgi:GR25 family glycosyltransferase involved in LPS biosynthesis